MEINYIQAPYKIQPPTIAKGKVPRIRHVKRDEVPEFYRKKRIIDRLKQDISEIILHIIGLTEFIRKGMRI